MALWWLELENCVAMRAKWLSVLQRLTPLWLSLWLVASLAHSPVQWLHDDGGFCEPCTFIKANSQTGIEASSQAPIEPVQGFDECCKFDAPQLPLHATTPDVNATDATAITETTKAATSGFDPLDCRQCCEPTSKHNPTHFIAHPFVAFTLGAPFHIVRPVQSEMEVVFRNTTSQFQSLPRPPPRGRAPPSGFSFA